MPLPQRTLQGMLRNSAPLPDSLRPVSHACMPRLSPDPRGVQRCKSIAVALCQHGYILTCSKGQEVLISSLIVSPCKQWCTR